MVATFSPPASAAFAARRATAPVAACGQPEKAPRYRHVVWIVMENFGYGSVAGSPAAAPYLARLAASCALATNYHAVTHPSLPNYVALTSGSTHGIADDAEPSAHRLFGPSIFSELSGNWKALEESMPTSCDKVTSGSYAARHNPAVYFTNLASSCQKNDVPLRYPLDLSKAFTFITPNICDDMHNCSVSAGDAWLSKVVPLILSSPQYRARDTAVFIVWDESDTGPANQVALYAVAPSIPRGLRTDRYLTHYSLLRTTEELLGVKLLGAALTAPSMRAALHL